MPSYQRVALFIFFDALERDLIEHIRRAGQFLTSDLLCPDERERAEQRRRSKAEGEPSSDSSELLKYLDFGDKISILSRHKASVELGFRSQFESKHESLTRSIPIRNATMHGRPLTTEEYSFGFALAQDLIRSPGYWPTLHAVYTSFDRDPEKFIAASISFIDENPIEETLNNLPIPDYDDTGFLPRDRLQSEISKKIRGRHPVICVLGDGGNGKTALTLQTLYSMIEENSHGFDAVVWVSAKTNKLTTKEVVRIENAITNSVGVFEEAANLLEPGSAEPVKRVRKLLEENRILLVIDNLETVLDDSIIEFAEEIPGESKLVFTSRVPLDAGVSVHVPEFTPEESLKYLRRLVDAYDVNELRTLSQKKLGVFAARLSHKPLLLKWFAIGVSQGLDPNRIVANPEMALRFCLENVIDRLDQPSLKVLAAMAAIPNAVSCPIIEHCGHLQSSEVESGLALLIRFGLIERASTPSTDERNFRIKPFVRAYVLRAARIVATDAPAVVARYRAIDATFQSERGSQKSSRYDGKFFVIRNKSEAVAAMRIKHAMSLAFRGEHDQADQIFNDLLISSPDYFEVHRGKAYMAYRLGDTSTASSAYEAAIELEPDLPQLRYFYGGFLMRALADYEGAAREFDFALSFDPDETAVLREAARVQFFMADFSKAAELIDRAKRERYDSLKDEVVVNDLEGQLYARQLEHLFKVGDPATAMSVAIKFHGFVAKLNPKIVDEKMAIHLLKAVPFIEALRQSPYNDSDVILDSLVRAIHDLSSFRSNDLGEVLLSSGEIERFGYMRLEGRTDRFGFIRDTFSTDTYVSRQAVNDVLWRDMCDGHPVKFNLVRDANGKTKAEKVVLVG